MYRVGMPSDAVVQVFKVCIEPGQIILNRILGFKAASGIPAHIKRHKYPGLGVGFFDFFIENAECFGVLGRMFVNIRNPAVIPCHSVIDLVADHPVGDIGRIMAGYVPGIITDSRFAFGGGHVKCIISDPVYRAVNRQKAGVRSAKTV